MNFWDTANNKTINPSSWNGKYSKADWDFYQTIRNSNTSPTVLHHYAGSTGKYYNRSENGVEGGDGLQILAPHHGRATGGNNDYLDTLNPRLSLLGNAASEYMDYNAWISRDLLHFTNNQAGNIILDIQVGQIRVLFTNETFAKNWNQYYWDKDFGAFCVGTL